MKTKGGKKIAAKPDKAGGSTGKVLKSAAFQNHTQGDQDEDDDLPEEHIKNLDEALKGADRGEPVTLNEFRKMAKKWGKDPSTPDKANDAK